MERIVYRKTLDVHKSGVQFMLQGFQTADNLSRAVEISLMASGDAIDFPLERVEALMYVTTPNATEPSINKCTIKDNKVVYDVLPIVEEGITKMQLKIIETSPGGATSVIASPTFAVEVTKSDADDSGAEQTTTFTALEDAMAKAKATYDERFLRMELSSDCIFRAYYADGTVYETDVLQKLFLNGNVLLSESFAHGGTGVRAGEDTDNSMYYSNVSKSESLNAKSIMENSEEILEEVKLHGVYTAFSVDFETGEVEYVSPSFKFNINAETGHLDADGQTYTFEEEIGRVVEEWLEANGVVLSDLQAISSTHTVEIGNLTDEIGNLKELTETHTEDIGMLKERVTPIELVGSHWWKRYYSKTTSWAVINTRYYVGIGNTEYDTIDIYIADSFSVSYEPSTKKYVYNLNNAERVVESWHTANGSDESLFEGKYWMIGSDSGYDLFYDTTWGPVACNSSTVDKWTFGDKDATYGFGISSYPVNSTEEPEGEAEYVFASSESEYPTGMGEDSLFYEYLGVPFENARESMKIETGSYVGTGTYGRENPTVIECPNFKPMMVIVGISNKQSEYFFPTIMARGINSSLNEASVSATLLPTFEDNSIYFYNVQDATSQQNTSGVEYSYIVIGQGGRYYE